MHKFPARVFLYLSGTAVTMAIVYGAGILLVPLFEPLDKAITARINPDAYIPGLDQFMRAATDYTNFLLMLVSVTWIVAVLIARLLPRLAPYIASAMLVQATVFAGLAAMGRFQPNTVYAGANLLFIAALFAVLGGAAWQFHTRSPANRTQWSRIASIALLAGITAGVLASNTLKDAVARPRPLHGANAPWNEQLRIIPDEVLRGANSFPSGHTTGTFALLAPWIWHARNQKARGALISLGVLQGLTRVYTAAHFPFCVVMGAFLGFTVGTLAYFSFSGPESRGATTPSTSGSSTL